MKYPLTACLMLCFSLSFAQLSVQNDAFVFVNDQVLFVTDDVNIDDADSKIYLRNEAQLLQGNPTVPTGNSGLGELSVYQNSEVNHFAYHYWCSPVGGILTNTNANNPFQVAQIDDPLFITADPVDSGNSGFTTGYEGTPNMTSAVTSMIISARWLYTFEISDEYIEWNPLTETSDINSGLGFTMKGMGPNGTSVNQIYDFRGKPNNGTITNNILAEQFTLIGNPYPSALDAADFLWDTDNVNLDELDSPPALTTGAIYYWEQDPANSTSHLTESYVGGYASYTCTEPDGSDNIVESFLAATYNFHLSDGSVVGSGPPQGGGRTASRYIPIGQGFMVEGAIGIPSSSVVSVKNSHRQYVKETAANSIFFRNGNQTTLDTSNQYDENGNFIVPDDYKRFRVIVSFNELYSRELLANFHDSASLGFDYGLEAKRPNAIESDAYWTQDNEAFVIQANSFDINLKIPLVIDVAEQQPLSFGIYDVQNFEGQDIFIHDIENGTFVDLKNQNYFINIEPGNYTDRFEIVFTTNALNVKDFDVDSVVINQNNGIHQLSVLNPESIDITTIEVYDVAGKRLLNGNYDAVLSRYELSTTNLSDGVYVVNVKSKTNAIKSQKVIVKN